MKQLKPFSCFYLPTGHFSQNMSFLIASFPVEINLENFTIYNIRFNWKLFYLGGVFIWVFPRGSSVHKGHLSIELFETREWLVELSEQ